MEREAQARRQAEWLTDKYILLMVLLFPLFTGFHGYTRIAQAKFGFFLALTGIWLLGLTVLLFRGLRPSADAKAEVWLLLVFLDWAIFVSLLSPFGFENTLTGGGRQNGIYIHARVVQALCRHERFLRSVGVDGDDRRVRITDVKPSFAQSRAGVGGKV